MHCQYCLLESFPLIRDSDSGTTACEQLVSWQGNIRSCSTLVCLILLLILLPQMFGRKENAKGKSFQGKSHAICEYSFLSIINYLAWSQFWFLSSYTFGIISANIECYHASKILSYLICCSSTLLLVNLFFFTILKISKTFVFYKT